jgi:cysteine synthase
VLLPSAREERKAENGATRVEATASPVAVAAGARVALFLPRNLHLYLLRLGGVSATGVRPAPVLLPSAREERKVENGATRVEATASPVAVAAGARMVALFLTRHFFHRGLSLIPWCVSSLSKNQVWLG